MALYKYNTSGVFSEIKEKPFKLERDIQRMFETNMSEIMGLEMIKSEFTIKDRRIDTLAFDPQSKAFVIIEYKRERNSSVIDQGFTYLSLMLQNQADFILEYNETQARNLKRNDVDWSQTKVVFVSQGFTPNQREAVNFKDLSIELWEVKRYENDSVSITPIRKSHASASIKTVMQNSPKSDDVVELYESYKNAILNLNTEIEVKPQKWYVSFKKANSHICALEIQKNGIKLTINVAKGHLEDSKQLTRDISTVGHFGNGDYELKISDTKYLEYIMSLVKQAIK